MTDRQMEGWMDGYRLTVMLMYGIGLLLFFYSMLLHLNHFLVFTLVVILMK